MSFDPPVRYIAYAVPVTHAGDGLRMVMLRGNQFPTRHVAALAMMAVLLVPTAYLWLRRSYRAW